VPKQGSLLVFKLSDGNYVKVLGDKLINRPEDRLKQV
ncbi:MAG TPA: ribonuclease P protein subunit, partial [Acidilobales archaeon]|nr:ribonuclease P protein subunit [Acidilobales archaeon]